MINLKFCSILAIAGALVAVPASAGIVGGIVTPLIEAGAPTNVDGPGTADSPTLRIDPNLPTSPYSGVVSINIRYSGSSFICTGTLIDATHVLSAGHCVDTTGNGNVIDVSNPGTLAQPNDVRVIFNASTVPGSPGRAIVTASNVVMHPDYDGFNICSDGSTGCVNDDLSIITLSQPAPVDAQIYAISRDAVGEGTSFTMVGYGTTGTGTSGYIANSADFRTKRSGTNTYDLTDGDDEQNFNGPAEVWYADFDGTDAAGNNVDKFCTSFGVCSGDLGNQSETNLGGGDSGGPSFIKDANGKLYLVANNTFGGTFTGQVQGTFGTYSGGILTNSYLSWIYANSDAGNVPEPAMIGLFGLGALGIAARRRKAA